jgi:hypothetical protein
VGEKLPALPLIYYAAISFSRLNDDIYTLPSFMVKLLVLNVRRVRIYGIYHKLSHLLVATIYTVKVDMKRTKHGTNGTLYCILRFMVCPEWTVIMHTSTTQ